MSGMFGVCRSQCSDVPSTWLVSMSLNTSVESRRMLDAGMKFKVTTRPDSGAKVNHGHSLFLHNVKMEHVHGLRFLPRVRVVQVQSINVSQFCSGIAVLEVIVVVCRAAAGK